ncbi:YciI family protein [Streptomyces monashensis]|uniref:YCII-related domain-containing protein n=1 Tax=Streptomyces monashensis TaxID=1678012 RepID=A0A1S2NZ57_9ACTN|nr:hypothetical protein [Streptomyces monashensis]OIJ86770.1 hypothetical protein BIV23_43605 [Streptomyces monashensis]
MLLMQFSEKNVDFPKLDEWKPEEIQAHIQFMKQTNAGLAVAGGLVDAQGLAMPETARIVRSHSGGPPVVTEGPGRDAAGLCIGTRKEPVRSLAARACGRSRPWRSGVWIP